MALDAAVKSIRASVLALDAIPAVKSIRVSVLALKNGQDLKCRLLNLYMII